MLEKIKEYIGYTNTGYRYGYIEFTGGNNSYIIKYGQMYEPPQLNFGGLIKLSELLGTTDITVDGYSEGGCETCDYGSDYGHEIYIKNITKNKEEFEKLMGTKYGEK